MRIKITYRKSSNVCASIVDTYGWYDLINSFNQVGILEQDVLKVEVVLDATGENTQDLTI